MRLRSRLTGNNLDIDRPNLLLSNAAPWRYRLPAAAIGLVLGLVGAFAIGEWLLPVAIFVIAYGTEIWWRRTHDPSEDGPYAWWTEQRREQKYWRG